jgi:sporulation related protein
VLTPRKKPDIVGPEKQYAVVLLNEEQLQQLMQRGPRPVNRGFSVRDVHSRYLRLKRQTTAVAIILLVIATGGVVWFMAPRPAMASIFAWKETANAPTLSTGASFSVTVASLDSSDGAGFAAMRVRSLGLPAFTRVTPDKNQFHQALAGPYATLDEAERVQRRLMRAGMAGARIFVDESLRNVPRNELPTTVPDGNPAVLLLGAPDRVSLVLEMPSEPRQVRSRRAEGLMDLDVGPLQNPVYAQQWVAPEGVHLIERVAIESAAPSENGQFLRAHIAVPEFARANVRSEGKRVYVDFTWPMAPADTTSPRSAMRVASASRPATVAPAPAQPAPAPVIANVQEEQRYAEAIRPIVNRLSEIKPFLMSAAQSGSPEVLKALDGSLASLDQTLKSVRPPVSATDQHQMLTAVLKNARRALDPAFSGDRQAQAQQAMAMYESSTVAVTP